MTTYLWLVLAVLVPVGGAALAVLARAGRPVLLAALAAAAVLMAMTAVFDNVIVGTGIVGYDEHRILGLRIGVAPVEDFAYAVVAALALPALWQLMTQRQPVGTRRPAGRRRAR